MDTASQSHRRVAVLRWLLVIVLVASTLGGGLVSATAAHSTLDERRSIQAQQGSPFPPLPAPNKTMGSIIYTTDDIDINDSVGKDWGHEEREKQVNVHAFRVGITKLNKSTFVITHRHGDVSKRWYIPNSSIWKKNGAFSDVKGWPGRIGPDMPSDLRRQLINQVVDTQVWDNEIAPFARNVHEQKTGKGFPWKSQSAVVGTVAITTDAPLPNRTDVEDFGDIEFTITKFDKPKDDTFVITHRHGNLTKNWTITNSSISLGNGQTGLAVEFAGDENQDAKGKVKRALFNHPIWKNEIVPFAQTTHYQKEIAEGTPLSSLLPSIPSIIDAKLKALAQALEEGAEWLLDTVYDLTLGTPVPENTGWHGILGEPTNPPFESLYNKLLLAIIYPLMNYFLGLGILVLGLSLAVNPLLSRYRVWDLMVKFTMGIFLYAFSWTAVTILHGTVRAVTNVIVPNPELVLSSAENLLKFGAAVPVAAYLGGSVVGFVSILEVGLVFGLRHILLTTVFPYVFAPVVLTAYIAPWSSVRRGAHAFIWQYINFLVMVIPAALILRAATVISYDWRFGQFAAVLVILGLLLILAAFPLITTYLFLQVPGYVSSGASSVASSALPRVRSATDRLDWRSETTVSDVSATAGTTPRSRAKAMSAAQASTATPMPSARRPRLDAGSSTTAASIRDHYDQHDTDAAPTSPAAMKQAQEQPQQSKSLWKANRTQTDFSEFSSPAAMTREEVMNQSQRSWWATQKRNWNRVKRRAKWAYKQRRTDPTLPSPAEMRRRHEQKQNRPAEESDTHDGD